MDKENIVFFVSIFTFFIYPQNSRDYQLLYFFYFCLTSNHIVFNCSCDYEYKHLWTVNFARSFRWNSLYVLWATQQAPRDCLTIKLKRQKSIFHSMGSEAKSKASHRFMLPKVNLANLGGWEWLIRCDYRVKPKFKRENFNCSLGY